jgi:CO/xanthine dehydrogenase Mo-binding subunit
VEVDAGTGRVKILRFSCLQDVGKAINPARIEAQLQGGAVQGLGWGLTEEVLFDAAGVVQNASLLDYRHLTSLDVPMIECEIIEVPAEAGPYGVRGVGEAPIIAPAAAVANAIRDATGIICDHAPMTPERLHQALHGQAHIDD